MGNSNVHGTVTCPQFPAMWKPRPTSHAPPRGWAVPTRKLSMLHHFYAISVSFHAQSHHVPTPETKHEKPIPLSRKHRTTDSPRQGGDGGKLEHGAHPTTHAHTHPSIPARPSTHRTWSMSRPYFFHPHHMDSISNFNLPKGHTYTHGLTLRNHCKLSGLARPNLSGLSRSFSRIRKRSSKDMLTMVT
ncbi:hypothetical protein LY78DRAFT_487796 [Colletotrichum sublineola]|nr:hypothetical protein LY78DRAFT_487796 [Colletotrichum sublineola]